MQDQRNIHAWLRLVKTKSAKNTRIRGIKSEASRKYINLRKPQLVAYLCIAIRIGVLVYQSGKISIILSRNYFLNICLPVTDLQTMNFL